MNAAFPMPRIFPDGSGRPMARLRRATGIIDPGSIPTEYPEALAGGQGLGTSPSLPGKGGCWGSPPAVTARLEKTRRPGFSLVVSEDLVTGVRREGREAALAGLVQGEAVPLRGRYGMGPIWMHQVRRQIKKLPPTLTNQGNSRISS